MYGIIYKATNKVNGKVYIGQTIKSLETRKTQHFYLARKKNSKKRYFQLALNKYGEENFLWEVIDTANSPEELNDKEEDWILFYGSYGKNGYNGTPGGNQNTIEGDNVYVFSTNGELLSEHPSQKEAALAYNVSPCMVAHVVHGKRLSVKNKVFLKANDFSSLKELFVEVESRKEKERIQKYKKHMVFGVDANGEAHMFLTIFEAEKKTGLSLKTILDECEKKKAVSTKWRFYFGYEFAKRELDAYRQYNEKVAQEMMNLYMKTQPENTVLN